MNSFLINFGTLVASHKFQTERYQQKRKFKNFLITFFSFNNPDEGLKYETFKVGKYFFK